MKTRDRIVAEARRLFNAQGYGNVSTAALAAHLGIAEGNLWYHFKTKRAILDAIAASFSEAIEARLAIRPGGTGDVLADYVALTRAMMLEFREFRFLYRDQASYGEHAELIAARAPDWLERTFLQLEGFLAALAEAGLLDWPRERLRDLSVNATIILRYGLDHFREMGEPTEEGSGAIRKTLARHLTLFEHRLRPDAAARLKEAIAETDSAALAEAA